MTLGQPLTAHTDAVYSMVARTGTLWPPAAPTTPFAYWGMNVDHAIQRICATTTNTLTPAQWNQYISPDLPYQPPCL
jgi:hypothetical protein